MFLRNFDNAMLLMLSFTKNSTNLISLDETHYFKSESDFCDGNLNVKYTNGTIAPFKLGYRYNYGAHLVNMLGLSNKDIVLGDSDTEVTYDDYKLSGNVVTNNLTSGTNTTHYDSVNKTYTTTFISTYTNNTEETITIKEWGLYNTKSQSVKISYAIDESTLLIYREVLPEPVVIEPGETATLTFQLTVGLMHQV